MSGDILFRRGTFIVFRAGSSVVAYNTAKPFDEGHTHLRSIKSAKDAILFVEQGKIPKRCKNYYLTSLQRLTGDVTYRDKIQELMDVRKSKTKQNYYNTTGSGI